MNVRRQPWFWAGAFACFVLVLYVLGGVLLPFVAAMAIAYFLDPVVGRLERAGLSRTGATAVVTLAFGLAALLAIVLLAPVIVGQAAAFAGKLPGYVAEWRARLEPLIARLGELVPPDMLAKLKSAAVDLAGPAANWLAGLIGRAVGGGMAVANLVSLAVITPIAAFYLLRDWRRLVAQVDTWLPRDHAETVRAEARKVDRTLSAFVRGQGLVCLSLACFYGIALSVVGLDFGLALGLVAGLVSFIPYVGALSGLIAGVALAVAQFGTLKGVALVVGVFAVGQTVESYVLTPRLVGDRIGLHPVWIIFALMAGGALFGFVGILVAVPVAAVIGVGARFALARYLESPYYRGRGGAP